MKRALPVVLVLALQCAPAQQTQTVPPAQGDRADALADHWGDSPQTAVAVPADAPNGGIDFENAWLGDRFGRFRRDAGGTGSLDGRRYDVVKIELADGEKKTVYFDITELWARSR